MISKRPTLVAPEEPLELQVFKLDLLSLSFHRLVLCRTSPARGIGFVFASERDVRPPLELGRERHDSLIVFEVGFVVSE